MPEEAMGVQETLDNHELRLQSLEDYRIQQERLNGEIRNKLTDTENTVLKESGKQQDLSQKLIDHVLQNDVVSRKAQRERNAFTQQQVWKIVGIAVGSGGAVAALIELLSS
ncbi:hypothetical protein NSQ54_10325 [Alkalihalobacillus sp. FSL W8-0930]